jgi:3-deoxy-D-manno-octulosonic-acid transferase
MAPVSLWIYRLVFMLVLPLAAPVLWLRDRLTGKSRPSFRERLAAPVPEIEPGGVWIHAVSVGEVELARRLVTEIRGRRPELPILLTATTATGLALARKTLADTAHVLVCPLDLPRPVDRAFAAADPKLLVLVETELWPEMLHAAGARGVAVAVVNGRLSEGSFARYRRIRGLFRTLLEPLSAVLVRDASDAGRFEELGVPAHRVRIAGNIKYDLEPDRAPLEWTAEATRLAGDRPVVVAGSTMEGEEQQLMDAVDRLAAEGIRPFVVVAPRHPERFDAVDELLRRRGLAVARRSAFPDLPDRADVWLMDSIGELARAYGLGAVAFIGGSLVPTGGHNPLEAAVWGVPVLSGGHVFNFQEVYDELVAAGGARLVADGGELAAALGRWLREADTARSVGAAGKAEVERNRGATARTVDTLFEFLDNPQSLPGGESAAD